VDDWRNRTGKPLSSAAWLEAHHQAKLPERMRFAKKLAQYAPRRIIDLGCATGLWLDLLHPLVPRDCEFIGYDSDAESLAVAKRRASAWSRPAHFEQLDIAADAGLIPPADLTLIFNVIPFIQDPADLLVKLSERRDTGVVAIRQYDGDSLRFGPMDTHTRALIEASLRSSVGLSEQFRHYDMDHVFELVHNTPYRNRTIEFELFERVAPFPPEFIEYLGQTLAWTQNFLSEDAAAALEVWRRSFLRAPSAPSYLFEVDLTAVLS
jgi:SAM-dependent methyltransferase